MSGDMNLSMKVRWRGREVATGVRNLLRDVRRTGDTGRATTRHLLTGTRNLDRATNSLHTTNGRLLRRMREIGRFRVGDKLAGGMGRAMRMVDRTTRSFGKLHKMQRAGIGLAAGYMAGRRFIGAPLGRTMDYGTRLAGMANTAYADRSVVGRIAGKKELNASVVRAVRIGGGTRDKAAETLDALIASGAMPIKAAMGMLPTLMKGATASGADPLELSNIVIRGMQTFKINPKDVERVLDMALTAGQEGGFELKDMARWLPQQMAAASLSGLSGLDGLARLLSVNQASAITAGTKDEAGNNLVNLLAKINSETTAKDAAKFGIDLPGTLAAARAKGVDSLTAFVGLTNKVAGQDPRLVALRKNAANAKGADARANFASQADILRGSAIGKLIQDRQALMALVALMNNPDYVRDVEAKVRAAKGTVDTNFAVMAQEMDFKNEQRKQEQEIATYNAFNRMAPLVNAVNSHLVSAAREYPVLTTAVVSAAAVIGTVGAGVAAMGLFGLLSKGGGSAAVAARGSSLLSRAAVTTAFAGGMPLSGFAAAAPVATGVGLLAAGGAGYGIGTLISNAIEGTNFADKLGEYIAHTLAAFGHKGAQEAIQIEVSVRGGEIVAEVEKRQKRGAQRH